MAELPEIDLPYDSDVYTPAEDTYLFVDALQDELPYLSALKPKFCAEIGQVLPNKCPVEWLMRRWLTLVFCRCGSGAVFVYLARELQRLAVPCMFLATDINPLAAKVAHDTATNNSITSFDIVRTDLLSCYETRLKGSLDVLLFNPPYVPTPSHEVGSTGIEAAWAGGRHGREVINRVLPKLKDLLSPHGVFYMVVVVENKPKEIAAILAKDGFLMTVVRSTKASNERLSILKFTRGAASQPQ